MNALALQAELHARGILPEPLSETQKEFLNQKQRRRARGMGR